MQLLSRRMVAAGNEPSQLYHITLFLMNQKDNVVSMESALQLMYLMHGKQDLDKHLQEIFGTSDLNSGVTLNLTNFLKSFHTAQVRCSFPILPSCCSIARSSRADLKSWGKRRRIHS
jgi:hypothetical protein